MPPIAIDESRVQVVQGQAQHFREFGQIEDGGEKLGVETPVEGEGRQTLVTVRKRFGWSGRLRARLRIARNKVLGNSVRRRLDMSREWSRVRKGRPKEKAMTMLIAAAKPAQALLFDLN